MSTGEGLEKFRAEIEAEVKKTSYTLNPDTEFLDVLFVGLFKNQNRYGYPSCPCRLAEGKFILDIDMICPCIYRDPDLHEYGRCYCAFYVNSEFISGKKGDGPIPERRPKKKGVYI